MDQGAVKKKLAEIKAERRKTNHYQNIFTETGRFSSGFVPPFQDLNNDLYERIFSFRMRAAGKAHFYHSMYGGRGFNRQKVTFEEVDGSFWDPITGRVRSMAEETQDFLKDKPYYSASGTPKSTMKFNHIPEVEYEPIPSVTNNNLPDYIPTFGNNADPNLHVRHIKGGEVTEILEQIK